MVKIYIIVQEFLVQTYIFIIPCIIWHMLLCMCLLFFSNPYQICVIIPLERSTTNAPRTTHQEVAATTDYPVTDQSSSDQD